MERSYSLNSEHQKPGPLELLMGLDAALSPSTGLHHWAHLQLAPPAMHEPAPRLTPVIGLYCCAVPVGLVCSYRVHTDSQDPLQLLVYPQLAAVPSC